MSTTLGLTDEQRDVISKIEKLMRLAGSSTSEAEASSAAEKAQALMLAYNLDASVVGTGEADGARGEEKMRGGFYEYERSVWRWVAEVNFCMYWSQTEWVPRTPAQQREARVQAIKSSWRRGHSLRHQHRVLGRRINVAATVATASYLLQATERLAREFVAGDLPPSADGTVVGLGAALRSQRAVSFREGVASRIVDKLIARRSEAMDEEARLRREAEARAAEAGAAGLSSSTAITISSLRQSEHDANMDHMYGAGWSATHRAERAARAKAAREAEETYAAWALAHPTEAAAQEAERRKETRTRTSGGRGSRGGSYGKDRDYAAYRAGEVAGAEVGVDPQASGGSKRGVGRTSGYLS